MGTHPRERVRTVVVTTPANTAAAAPQSTTWDLGSGVLERVDIVIADGHAGLTGIQLLWGGRQVLPYEAAEWLTGNDDEITVELGLWTGAGRVVVRTYNTDDTYRHTHHLRAYVVDRELAPALVLGPGFVVPVDVPEIPEVPEEPAAPGELDPEEEVLVAQVLDQFLSDLSELLDGFLSQLQTTLSGTTPVITEEPPPEEVQPPKGEAPGPTSGGAQDGEDHHHHKHGSGPHRATVNHQRSPAHPGHHHWWGANVPASDHHPHRHTHADGTTH